MIRLIFTMFIGLSLSVQLNGQGIDFFHGTFNEALEEAEGSGKMIFIDAYASWCGPCKRMAKQVFPLPEVGEVYNKNFVNLKIDMEKGEGLKLRKKLPVSAYPTFFFLDSKGKIVHQVKGGRSPEGFIKLALTAIQKNDNSAEYAEMYENGKRDFNTVYNYVKALNKAGKQSLKISNDYLNSQSDLNTDDNLRFILEACIEADSRIFDLLVEKRKAIENIANPEDVEQKIQLACKNTLEKAVSYNSKELLDEAKMKCKAHVKEGGDKFAFKADLVFFGAQKEEKNYLKSAKSYVKKIVKNSALDLDALSKDIFLHFDGKSEAMKYAETLSEKACENGGMPAYYYTYAQVLNKNKNLDKALEVLDRGISIAREQGDSAKDLINYKKRIEKS